MSAHRRGDRLSSDDAARLHMESAGSPMTITIVILLAGELSLDTVVQRAVSYTHLTLPTTERV